MADSKNLVASQQFMTRELLSYEDELFGLLYHDIEDFAAQRSPKIVSQDRRISIYGVRGVGKTTAMQGVLWHALSTSKDTKVMPITITVKGAKAASSIKELNHQRNWETSLLLSHSSRRHRNKKIRKIGNNTNY